MTRVSRREFARAAGAAVGVALLPAAARGGQPKKPATPSPAPPTHAPPPAAPHAAPATADATEAEARVQTIVARYGARLSPAERADLQRLSADAQKLLDEVRAYPLDYGDEPAHIFRAPRRTL